MAMWIPTQQRGFRRCLLLSPLLLIPISCQRGEPVASESVQPSPNRADVRIDRRMFDSPAWIDAYDADSSFAGYTLVLYRRRTPMLIDMNGEVVHSWPGIRVVGRARLLPSGNLAVIAESGSLEEYDWQGRQVWSFTLPDPESFLHHDFIRLENGNHLILAHDPAVKADFLLEVDRAGKTHWRWDAIDGLESELSRASSQSNKTHINSVHELPPNRWFENGLEAFQAGNILISARNLNAIYIVSRPGGEVVWRHYDGLDYQHEAMMISPGLQGAGNILFFNNGYHDRDAYRQSAIVEINPVDGRKVWEWRRRGFFSSTGGTQQLLPNGNLLVTSSQGGRVFELTRDGRIVWQWSPPFLPMRALRYEADFTAALEDLQGPSRQSIERRDPNRFVDEDLYTFSLAHQTRRLRLPDKTRHVLKEPNRCQVLQIPPGAELVLGFGAWTEGSDTPFIADEGPARFHATLRFVDQDQAATVLDRWVDKASLGSADAVGDVILLSEKVPLDTFDDATVELCLSLTGASGDASTGTFVWEEPLIRSPVRRAAMEAEDEIDPETLEKQERHLKAIGYIN